MASSDVTPSRRPRAAFFVAIAALALIAVVGVSALTARWAASTASAAEAAPSASASTETEAEETAMTTEEIYAMVAPSVVVLEADDAVGSGVIVNEDGSILTALHVVDGAAAITVTYYDGTTTTATVSESDEATDTATLVPDALPEVLVPATIGGGVAVGDTVIAIGTPLGLSWSVSEGVVSGVDRTLSSSTETTASDLIQFDAAVNPGSSGGPLVNSEGQVVGIVVALLSADEDDEGFSGIGLAVPLGTALAGDGGTGDAGPQQ